MNILTSIETARGAGVNDDLILNEIIKQNPNKKTIFEEARKRGANSSDIINEVVRQNKNVKPTSIFDKNTQKQQEDTQPIQEEKSGGIINKVGKFFTGATQKFAKTLGTAASVIDPVTKDLRKETLSSSQGQVDKYLKMAKEEKNKDKKDALLKAASYLADTEGVDIYNNPEYQKTAKQIYGEAIGVAAETLGWGKIGGIAKAVPASTVAQTVLKSAGTGAVLGGVMSTGSAMEENKSTKDIIKSGAIGATTGAVVGGALGYASGKISGKLSQKEATKLVSKPLSTKTKQEAYKAGRVKPATFLKSEKVLPTRQEKELGKLAQEIGIKGNIKKDITKVNSNIEKEASALKETLKKSGAIYNKNNVKGTLNKMKSENTVDLIDSEVNVYDKMISKFNKMVDAKKNKGLDGLLELRQEFDSWAKSNTPSIFESKTGGAYRAVSSVRNAVNDYINNKVGDDIVKNSLRKQTQLYTMLDNISRRAVTSTKLKSSTVSKYGKKLLPWAIGTGLGAAGIKAIGNKNSSNDISSYYTPN